MNVSHGRRIDFAAMAPTAETTTSAPDAAHAPTRASVVLAFAAVYLVWGSTYLAIRWVLESLPPLLTAGARFLVAGGVLLAWAAWSERSRPEGPERVGLTQWKWSVLIGALLFLGGNGAVMWAEQRVPSGVAALMVAIMPCCLALLEWLGPS